MKVHNNESTEGNGDQRDALPQFDMEPKIVESSARFGPIFGRYGGPLVFVGPPKLRQAQVATWVLLALPQIFYFPGLHFGLGVLVSRRAISSGTSTAFIYCSAILLVVAAILAALCSFTEPGSIPRRTRHVGEKKAIEEAFLRNCRQAKERNKAQLDKLKAKARVEKRKEGEEKETKEEEEVTTKNEYVKDTNEARKEIWSNVDDEKDRKRLSLLETRGFPFNPIASNKMEPSLAAVSPARSSSDSSFSTSLSPTTSRLESIQLEIITGTGHTRAIPSEGNVENGTNQAISKSVEAQVSSSTSARKPPQIIHITRNEKRLVFRWCDRCAIYRPPRTLHCPWCNHCCEELDHHCPWLNNCIAKNNMYVRVYFARKVTATFKNRSY